VGPFLNDPNRLCAVLVFSVPLALILALRGTSRTQRAYGWAALAVLLSNVYLTNSRGGTIALAVALGVLLIHFIGWFRGCLLAAGVLALMLAFGPDRFHPDLQGDDSAMGRIMAWEAGLRMFEESPLFGVGYDQFIERHPLTAHNAFMLALAETGFLGALAWLGLNYWAVLTATRVRRAQRLAPSPGFLLEYGAPLQAGLLATLAASFFESTTYSLFPLIAVALASALGGLAPRTEPRPRNWYHFLLILCLTVGSVFLMYVLAKVQL
jgi:O-antigen ligase